MAINPISTMQAIVCATSAARDCPGTMCLQVRKKTRYVASVPALPGCVSQGDTRGEALNNIREAVELYVEDCRDAGDPIPTGAGKEFVESKPRKRRLCLPG